MSLRKSGRGDRNERKTGSLSFKGNLRRKKEMDEKESKERRIKTKRERK